MSLTRQPHIGLDHQLPAPSPDPPRRSSGVRVLVWIVILLVFAIGIYYVLNRKDAPAEAGGGGGPSWWCRRSGHAYNSDCAAG